MSNIFSFFGQEIKTGAPQAFEIPFGEVILHLSTVSLAKDTPKGSITRVFVHSVDEDEKETKYVICTLVGKEKESVSIDLNFSEDVALSIETSANDDTTVHVTGYINLINEDGEEDESDEEEKAKLLRKMLEEDDDEDDEDFKPDLNESSESAKLEELSDEDEMEGDDLDDDQTEEVVKRVQDLENRLGREANDEEIKEIVTRVQAGQPEPAPKKKEQPKKEQPKKQPQQQQQKQQQQPKEDKKRSKKKL
uniref:Nucleolar basal body binding protein BN46/51 small subunit n=1 Tax=Naegleria gruberi TaxID=5762 RepID=O77235_NAEGR|nr:nucleolar basal body binding protein BN46/51 small subunit [Naegleria gruberi]